MWRVMYSVPGKRDGDTLLYSLDVVADSAIAASIEVQERVSDATVIRAAQIGEPSC